MVSLLVTLEKAVYFPFLIIKKYPGEPLVYGLQDNTGLFYLLIFFLLILGFLKVLEPGYFGELFRSLLDLNYVNLMKREGRLSWNVINIFLDLVYIGSLAFFIYQLQITSTQTLEFWEAFLWVFGISVGHVIFAALLGNVFYGLGNIGLFVYNVLIFNRVLGIILLPIIFVTTYFAIFPKEVAFYCVGILILAFLSFRILRALFQMGGIFKHGFIYNFFYLCTVEISPLIIVIDLITDNFLN